MDTVQVTLGGKTYPITPLPYGPSKRWREQLSAPLGEIASVLMVDLEEAAGDLAGVGSLVAVGQRVLVGAPDLLVEMLFAYAPNLAEDRAHIEAQAYDGELMAAFLEVLKLAYPFGGLLKLLGSPGRQGRSTSKNSPLPSGASRRKG